MRRMKLEGKRVLVTGASSGLGREIATQLARDYRANLILTARRTKRIESLSQRLQRDFHTEADTIAADLCLTDDLDRLAESMRRDPPYAIVLCAGETFFGPSLEMDEKRAEQIVALNATSVMKLCLRLVPTLTASGERGGLMIVSSLGGLLPLPYQSVYSGTKAFLYCFGLGLQYELRGSGVSVTTVTPGGIDTEMLDKSGLRSGLGDSPFNQAVETCARQCLASFVARKPFCVPGRLNRIALTLAQFAPRRWTVSLLGRVYRTASTK